MKLQRTDRDFGGGGGQQKFNSQFFRVVWWRHGGEEKIGRTTLEIVPINKEIQFEGKVALGTDDDCFDQLNTDEIKALIIRYGKHQFRNGKEEKQREILEVLGINQSY
jgi:hypothetical protein